MGWLLLAVRAAHRAPLSEPWCAARTSQTSGRRPQTDRRGIGAQMGRCSRSQGGRVVTTIGGVPLLERTEELSALDDRWAQARLGRGGMVVVKGDPGAGKTSLVRTFADAVEGGALLWGACDPLSTPRPLGPLYDVAHLLDAGSRAALETAEQSHEIFGAVFARLAAEPTVLVVDDLHWADQGTVDLLRFVLRRIRTTHSLIVVALRDRELADDHPVRGLLGDVARSADAESVILRPLSLAAIADLVGDRPVDATRIELLTGGNPFFVTEMLDHDSAEMPASVRDAILDR